MKEGRNGSDFETRWRERFEEFANRHDDDAGIAGWSASGLDTRMRFFRRLLVKIESKSIWLDAGCGAGTYSRYLALLGATVVGLDYSVATVRKAKERASGGCSFAVADVTRLPLRAGSFDGAICFGVIQALEQSENAVHELARCVRPGAEIWVDALNRLCVPNLLRRFGRWLKRRPRHLRYESPRALTKALNQAGLVDIKVTWVPILPGKLGRFQAWVETPVASWLFHAIPGCGLVLCHSFVVMARRPG